MLYQKFPSEDDRILAGEHALGLLSEIEAVKFERRLDEEPILQAIYNAWLLEFPPLDGSVPREPADMTEYFDAMLAVEQSDDDPNEVGNPPAEPARSWSALTAYSAGILPQKPRVLAVPAATPLAAPISVSDALRITIRRKNWREALRQIIIGIEIAAIVVAVIGFCAIVIIGAGSDTAPAQNTVITSP